MGRVQLPQWRPTSVKPPGPVNADLVRANCARLGLPVPSRLWLMQYQARESIRGGLATGTVTWNSYGVLFDGTNYLDVVELPSIGAAFTFAAFDVEPYSTGIYNRGICEIRVSDATRFALLAQGYSTGLYGVHGCNYQSIVDTSAVATRTSVVVTRDTTNTMRLYVAGQLNGTPKGGASGTGTATNLRLGSRYPWDSTTGFGRSVGGFAIWETVALSASQVATVSAAWAHMGAPPPRTLFFDLAAGGGTVVPALDEGMLMGGFMPMAGGLC